MTADVVVDARWLEPPEPMQRVLQALETRGPGQRLRLLIHREPYPLYDLLDARGIGWRSRALADGCYEILIGGQALGA